LTFHVYYVSTKPTAFSTSGNISADWIPRVPNQPSSKCKKHCKHFVELARVDAKGL